MSILLIDLLSTAACARDSKPVRANLMDDMHACHNYESLPCLIFRIFFLEDERIFITLTMCSVKSKVHQMSPVRLEPKKIYESAFQVTYCYEANAT